MPLDHRHRLPYQPTPRRVEALADVKIVQGSVGDWHSLVVSSEGCVYTWGSAEYGRLGYADTSHLPVDDQKVPYQTCPTLLNTLQTERVKQVSKHTISTPIILISIPIMC
jgi:alpha-tubulin suppressor-like RCC1 family protein